MSSMFLSKAIAEAVHKEMERDERVILIGEDMKNLGGGFSIYAGVPDAFPERVLEMPISESSFTNFGNGAAMMGYRPVIDIMFSDFSTIASDAIINNAAKYRFVSNGKEIMPVVYIMGNGSRGTYGSWSTGCNHCQCAEAWYHNVPGLKICMPYYPEDAHGLLRAAIRDDDPVLFFFHVGSLGIKGPMPDEDYIIGLEHAAKVIEEGTDITVIAFQSMVPLAVKASAILKEKGISAEIIDPRVLVPLDKEKIVASVKKTGRALIVHEAPVRGGIGGEVAAVIADECFGSLKAPVKRLGALNSPSVVGPLEYSMMVHTEDIVAAAAELASF
jgi:pyruvate/2-oxoglutarate/acetoin dehydrogenase E1 component